VIFADFDATFSGPALLAPLPINYSYSNMYKYAVATLGVIQNFGVVHSRRDKQGRLYVGVVGHVPPDSLVAPPPDSQAS